MVGASKILTVSYGTFSCTLEGFDDSFGTMKAIAEYFRDLAADDRYFGAEPPTPDAEMLQRIAEREIRKRVEARVDGDSVLLRASLPEPEAPAAQPPQAAPAPVAEPAPAAETPARPAEPAETAPEDDTANLGSVAAKLARIRSVVDSARRESPYAEDQHVDADFFEAPAAADVSDAFAEEEAAPETNAPEEEPETDENGFAGQSADETGLLPDAALSSEADYDEEYEEEGEATDQHSILSAVALGLAATGQAGAPDAEDEAEDTAEADEAAQEVELAEPTVDFAPDAVAEEPLAEQVAEPAGEPQPEETGEKPVAAVELVAEPEEAAEQIAEPEEAIEAAEEDADETEHDAIAAAQAFAAAADDSAEPAEDLAEHSETEDVAEIAETGAETEDAIAATLAGFEDEDEDEEDEDSLDDSADAEPGVDARRMRRKRRSSLEHDRKSRRPDQARSAAARARARVLKIKRTELEEFRAELEETELAPEEADEDLALPEDEAVSDAAAEAADAPHAEDAPETGADAQPDDDEEAQLSAEAEAELMAELAEVERDTTPGNDTGRTPAGSRLKPVENGQDEAAVSRLVDKVNSKMEGQDHQRRRSAIAHLKAAVAATVADGLRSRRDREAEAEEQRRAYRKDLDETLRTTPRGASPAPKPSRMPPLMLVSEQRIDLPGDTQDTAAVSHSTDGNLALRQDEAGDDHANIFSDEDSFADFAERMDASDLTDLLEAAAAYTVTVEKQPHFTRPQVMRTVTEYYGDAGLEREKGLRAFGKLLRDGPFERAGRGEFTISKSSRFMPGEDN